MTRHLTDRRSRPRRRRAWRSRPFVTWRERPPEPPPPPQPLRAAWSPGAEVEPGAGADYLFGLALAADGRRLVYPAAKAGVVTLWLQDLRTGETRALPGTDQGVAPFWSADGRGSDSSPAAAARPRSAAGTASARPRSHAGRCRPCRRRIAARRHLERRRRHRVRARRQRRADEKSGRWIDRAVHDVGHRGNRARVAVVPGRWPARGVSRHVERRLARGHLDRAARRTSNRRRRLMAADAQAIVDRASTLLFLNDQTLMAQPLDPRNLRIHPAAAHLSASASDAGRSARSLRPLQTTC